MKYFFCGIGGIGMSSIAFFLKEQGHIVAGSDRSFDQNQNADMKERLCKTGMALFPQTGIGVDQTIDVFVVSTAVENTIPDVQKANELGLKIMTRAQVLAQIANKCQTIAIGGTSGKTSTTAMTAHILHATGRSPNMLNGGISINTYNNHPPSNFITGKSDLCVIEADESDGSIELYHPAVAVMISLTLDHKPLEELRPLFSHFIHRASRGVVLNMDDPETALLKNEMPETVTISTKTQADYVATDIVQGPDFISFKVNGHPVILPILGTYNAVNALAAVAACALVGVPLEDALKALESFKGTKRRMEKIGEANGVFVFDDYAHNPEKIAAALKSFDTGRTIVIYQPHGYGPTRLMKNDLIQAFSQNLKPDDILIMPEIFYAGGTAVKDISSKNITDAVGKNAFFFEKRADIIPFVQKQAIPGDRIIVMGARDPSLSDFACDVARSIK